MPTTGPKSVCKEARRAGHTDTFRHLELPLCRLCGVRRGLSWAAVCHPADMQGALGVTSDVLIPGLRWQGQEGSVNIYPSQLTAFRVDESPAARPLWGTPPSLLEPAREVGGRGEEMDLPAQEQAV